MKILITGADGFIARNLIAHLRVRDDIDILTFTKRNNPADIFKLIEQVDFVFHLAGVNRPDNLSEFRTGNIELTQTLCEALVRVNKKIPILYISSLQATLSNPYGDSKREAEKVLENLSDQLVSAVYIYRLPNVFGKWAKPNYNSAVATFCYNVARNLPIQINDPLAEFNLVHIDDVVAHFIDVMDGKISSATCYHEVDPVYKITVGELARQIQAFRESRSTLITEQTGTGLIRALYSTYVSYLPVEMFSYGVPKYADPRGVFVEMLKTKDSGQFSFFTAPSNTTRGGHYHHTKTEKFLVIKGSARFRFRHIMSEECYELFTSGDSPAIVETVPGWSHDITNVGEDEMVVMLWANEIFDRSRPDTYACQV